MIGVQGQTPDELHQGVGPWTDFTQPTVSEQRTHFGIWCVLSAPLTLSIDFRNETAVDSVWDIITNTQAIAVNQAWAGSPGTVFASSPTAVDIGPRVPLRGEARVRHVGEEERVIVPEWQAWYKPLPGNGAAIIIANHGNKTINVTINFADVPGLGPPPPSLTKCNARSFPVDLHGMQCMGLNKSMTGSVSAAACCNTCTVAGASCETWQYCGGGACTKYGVGCYLGRMLSCHNSTDGWVSRARSKGPAPPQPPPSPPPPTREFVVTDVWTQTDMPGTMAVYSIPALASHDSVFITVRPPGEFTEVQ